MCLKSVYAIYNYSFNIESLSIVQYFARIDWTSTAVYLLFILIFGVLCSVYDTISSKILHDFNTIAGYTLIAYSL